MSPWWLRPPADEPGGSDESTGLEGSGGLGQADGDLAAREDLREGSSESEGSPDASAPRQARQVARRPSRRRSRRGQARRPQRSTPEDREGEVGPADAKQKGSRGAARASTRAKDRPPLEDRRLVVICDLESTALGLRDTGEGHLDIDLVLERLLDKGKIIVKRAYADWERHSDVKRSLHQAGMELIDIPREPLPGRGGADIRIAVDAMELCYSKQHLDTFVLISGNGDLTPLVSKLKGNNRHVIGVGSQGAAATALIDSCDEYLFYEDLRREVQESPQQGELGDERAEAFHLLIEAIQVLMRENQQTLWGSVIKQTIQRQHPSFNESHYGFSSFSKMLEKAQEDGIIRLRRDERSGSYVVTGFGKS